MKILVSLMTNMCMAPSPTMHTMAGIEKERTTLALPITWLKGRKHLVKGLMFTAKSPITGIVILIFPFFD